MKVNGSAGFERYQSIVNSAKSAEAASAKKTAFSRTDAATNTDKVTLSDEAAAKAGAYRLASALSTEVDGVASEERLAALQARVAGGSYHVGTDDLADAILGVLA